MAYVPSQRVNVSNNIAVLNAIRNSASTYYQDYVPAVADASGVREIGVTIMQDIRLQNEFLQALINRIGRVNITSKIFQNPLRMFKKGVMEFGDTIEDIYVNLPEAHEYDPAAAESTVFAREFPDVRSAFYTVNYEKFYKQTIQRRDLARCFTATDGIASLVEKILTAMDSANSRDEFLVTKYLLAKRILDGFMTFKPVVLTGNETAKELSDKLLTSIRTNSNQMEFLNTERNLAGVQNFALKDDQYIIISAASDALFDVNSLAYAFNMDRAALAGHIVRIDDFGNIPDDAIDNLLGSGKHLSAADKALLSGSIQAVIVDSEFFQIWDVYDDIADDITNPQGLYKNAFLNVSRIFAVSPFANNTVIHTATSSVTSVTVTPSSTSLAPISVAAGQSVQLNVSVVATLASKAVTYEIDTTGDIDEAEITSGGLVTMPADATAADKLIIDVVSVADPTKKATVYLVCA